MMNLSSLIVYFMPRNVCCNFKVGLGKRGEGFFKSEVWTSDYFVA